MKHDRLQRETFIYTAQLHVSYNNQQNVMPVCLH